MKSYFTREIFFDLDTKKFVLHNYYPEYLYTVCKDVKDLFKKLGIK